LFWAAVAAAAPTETVQVRHALDGDSLVLTDGRQVRLLGVNAPEMSPVVQPLARAARTLTAQLTEGRRVMLTFETDRADHYGRLLAHVQLPDGRDLEEILLRRGLGWLVAIPPDVEWVARLARAEADARAAHRGVWSVVSYEPIDAEHLTAGDTGFHFVSGTIRSVHEGAHVFYFDLTPTVSILVPRDDWQRYFADAGHPRDLRGRRIVARGWLTSHDNGLRLRVGHPAMLTWQH
jgi:micrococcal nuclease